MAVKGADLESELIDTVCERVRERLPADQVAPCESFVRQYYQWVPAEDLADRNPLDLYGAAVAHYNLAQQRAAGESKVRVYNPDFEQHGWQSPHTLIEVVTDDMPFIVDSVTMQLGRLGYGIDLVIHPVMKMRRDDAGHLIEVLEQDATADDAIRESIVHVEVGREHDRVLLDQLRNTIERVLADVRAAVEDWQEMRSRTQALIEEFDQKPPPTIEPALTEETKAFLGWLAEDNFTLLGYREYDLIDEGDEARLQPIEGSGLGILRGVPSKAPKKLSGKALVIGREPQILLLTKANSASPIHRPAYLDYIGVKKYSDDGKVIGERRFLGLYTTRAYKASPRSIPIIRGKVEGVLERAGFPPASHDRKALLEILESYTRDSLFQMETEDLYNLAIGILGLGERQRLRLFVWRDPLERFVECLVCIPRDRFNTENRERVGRILLEALGGVALDWTLQLSESRLARVHYIIRLGDEPVTGYDVATIEARLAQTIRAWADELREALIEDHGEEEGIKLFKRYERAFPAGYKSDWVARSAVADIGRIEELVSTDEPLTSLYRPLETPEGMVRLKLFSAGGVLLSEVLPTLEHLGAKVADERPYEIAPANRSPVWIYDFGLQADAANTERVRDLLHDTFIGVWRGDLEDDALNGLVLGATLTGRQVSIIRAVAKYLRQGGIGFSDSYIGRTLIGHAEIVRLLVRLFEARLDPDARDDDAAERLGKEIEEALDAVPSLDEDRILRSFLSVVRAIVRTNTFQNDADGKPHPYLSFKLDSAQIPILPLPRPQFEIFVYSPRLEAVHLRGGKVARGGLRWSDRPEDFRTEVLGLMKAQMVKNALIVPVGAKGGFVVKRPPAEGGREALQREGIACYKAFLSGMLDITDNIVEGEVVPPKRVVRYDDDDPYLVVAADKGTATFSDIANEVSQSYGFWLGDAFASGGSNGYDHKAMGITARGAWESVKRHFRELGTDIQTTDFTAVGIGDMSGDVFGNGMLCSRHTKLLAAFNHMHVFIDPDPDPNASYDERKRLFDLPRSAWSDYDESLISEGGGDLLAQREVDHALPPGPRGARHRGRAAPAQRPDPGDPQGAGRPAVQRRHRDLREGLDRVPRGCRRQGQRRGPGRRTRAPLQGRRRGRQPRRHPKSSHRVRPHRRSGPKRRADHQRRDRQRRRRQHLRPRGQHQDPARRPGRGRRYDREAAQRAAGGDDRLRRRAGPVRELYADRGDQPGARAGAADGRRPRAADPESRADRRAEPQDRVPADRRRDRRAEIPAPGPGRAGTRGGHGLLQDPPLPAAARLRPARGRVPHPRPRALLP